MKQLEKLLKAKSDLVVLGAQPAGPKRVFVALEVFVYETEAAATCVIGVDLDTLAVELVHEANGSSVAYAYRDGWHGLAQRQAIVEVVGGKAVVTKASLGEKGAFAAITRHGAVTLVCGTKKTNKYAIDGFLARVESGKLAMLLQSSKQKCDEGGFAAIAIGANGKTHTAGSAMQDDRTLLFSGGATFTAAPVLDAEIYSLHETTEQTIMVGGHEACAIVRAGKAVPLTGVVGRVEGVTEFRGTEYWMSHDLSSRLLLSKRTGTKLAKKYGAKFHYIGYRHLDGAPNARIAATEDLLAVTNKDRIHLFDGKKWSQLGVTRDVKKLVKRLPAAMK